MGGAINKDRFYVYTYSYPNGVPFYVGLGSGKRINSHIYAAKSGKKDYNSYKQRIIQKILLSGEEPVITKIIYGIEREFAALIEQEYIAKFGRRDSGGLLVNMTDGGDGVFGLSAEAAERKRKSLVAATSVTRFKKGHTANNKGVPMSDASKQKCREANLGKRYALGVVHTVEARANMSAAHKGKPSGMLGKKHTIETIEKMRLAKICKPSKIKGRKNTSETIEKMKVSAFRAEWLCHVCGKTGYGKGAGIRWHFANCKKKET